MLLWLALVGIVGGLFASLYVAGGFGDRARITTAMVTSKEPTNHATVRAIYEVNGILYEIADSSIGPPNPSFDDVRVGATVTVYFDPNAPDRAVLFEPLRRSSLDIGVLVVAAVCLPAFALGFLWVLLSGWSYFRGNGGRS